MAYVPIHAHSTDRALRRFTRKVGKENVLDLMDVRRADILALGKQTTYTSWAYYQELLERLKAILESDTALSVSDLAINGHDVIDALGILPVLRWELSWSCFGESAR